MKNLGDIVGKITVYVADDNVITRRKDDHYIKSEVWAGDRSLGGVGLGISSDPSHAGKIGEFMAEYLKHMGINSYDSVVNNGTLPQNGRILEVKPLNEEMFKIFTDKLDQKLSE